MPKIQAQGDAAPGRLARGRRVSTTLSEINVVPLVDVMLVLLIIFMVTAPMIQRGIDVNLPVATRTNQIVGERVIVTVPMSYRKDRRLYLGEEPLGADAMQERVRQQMEGRTEKQVYLRGDGELLYRELVEVIDRLKAAGVENVGLELQAPSRRSG
jgi:biopolymer transport protein ExbD